MALFKFPSIAALFSKSTKAPPTFDPITYLATAPIAQPQNSISNDHIPYLELRRILFIHRDRNCACPIRKQWNKALIETQEAEQSVVSFQNIKGCMSSKSGLTDFEQMRTHPKSLANVEFHIKTYAGREDELAEKVLNGTIDCAAYKDQPAHIVQQDWNKDMWIANDGGSHRTAAVWHLDREQGHNRLLPARISTKAVSPDFRAQCDQYSIWLFQLQSQQKSQEIVADFKKIGLLLSAQNDGLMWGDPHDLCLIVEKSDPRHDAIAATLKNAFCLSDWVQNAYAPKASLSPIIQPTFTPQ